MSIKFSKDKFFVSTASAPTLLPQTAMSILFASPCHGPARLFRLIYSTQCNSSDSGSIWDGFLCWKPDQIELASD